jgi:CubicO group peptidase (beta-lactamase class C family)
MPIHPLTRRNFLVRSAFATVAAGSGSLLPIAASQASASQAAAPTSGSTLEEKLDRYIAAYMPVMNAPGLTLALTNSESTLRTSGYGFANIDQKLPVTTDHLFQIGSITKSFVALVILQLREEAKLDLHKPVLDYLPDLPIITEFGPITTHHLLTHTSGLPDNLGVFTGDPTARLVQGFKPGEHFHYCNAGFDILGLLAAKLDGRPWRHCVQARILTPPEMTATTPVITTSSRDRAAIGYQAFWDDQQYPRRGKLAPAPNLVTDDTAGCIASTPGDMARYLRMLLNHGQGPHGRIVSEESFTLFSTPFIKADDFSSTASYGYGVAVDTLEGHKILRHTGGMVAFASSMHVDLDGGVAAYASINAMQGFRPTAVTDYALRLLRAQHEAKPLPAQPAIADPRDTDNAAEYAGTYTSSDGAKLVFTAEGKRLSLVDGSITIPLQHEGGDSFISTVAGLFATHSFVFSRKQVPGTAKSDNTSANSKPQPPVVEVSYGPDWFVTPAYDGPRTFASLPEYAAYPGRYRADSAWGGDLRVYLRKGKLVASGQPLVPLGANLFRTAEDDWTPETAEFVHIFQGKARLLKLAGTDFWRIEVD